MNRVESERRCEEKVFIQFIGLLKIRGKKGEAILVLNISRIIQTHFEKGRRKKATQS